MHNEKGVRHGCIMSSRGSGGQRSGGPAWLAACGGRRASSPRVLARRLPALLVIPLNCLTSACLPLVQVEEVTPTEVVCVAASDAVLDGLLTVFHIERSGGE